MSAKLPAWILLFAAILAGDAAACPPPPTLRELIEAADAIVIGKVIAAGDDGITIGADRVLDDDPRLGPSVSLRGERAARDATVLAFLKWDASAGTWRTARARGGLRPLAEEAAGATCAARIVEYLAIAKIADRGVRRAAARAWLVRCAVDPLVRRELAEDLEDLRAEDGRFGRLAPGERARIVEALLAVRPAEGRGALPLVRLASGSGDARVARWCAERLERIAAGEKDEIGAAALMEAAAEALDWGVGRALAERWRDGQGEDERAWFLDVFLTRLARRLGPA